MYNQAPEIPRNTLTNHSYRSSHHTSSRSHISHSAYRPPSELLCDLHVYKVPPDLWRDNFNNILNSEVTETVSIGIIRVPTEVRLVEIREEIVQQLQADDQIPRDYVFLRSVGRSLTRLRGKQEYQLKAKHFLPPVAFAPELYILEATPEIRDALAISDRSSQSPPLSRRTSPYQRGYPPNTYRNGYPEKGRDRRHDDDSGVAGLSPEDEYSRRNRDDYDSMLRKHAEDSNRRRDSQRLEPDDEAEEERRRRLEDLEGQNLINSQRWDAEQEERRRRAEEDRKREAEEKRRKDEQERRTKNEEERRKREEEQKKKEEEEQKKRDEEEKKRREEIEKRRRDEEERKKREQAAEERRKKEEQERQREEERLRKQNEDENRYSSPAGARQHSPSEVNSAAARDTESARQRRRDEKNQLLKDIEEAREARQTQEKEREELVKKAKQMQHKTTNRRNEARDMWKKKYFEEKKKTAPLEENSNRLRNELEALHKRLMNTLEGPKEKNLKLIDSRPSEKNNYIIQCSKLQHEIEDIQRRVENARMKLTAEMKVNILVKVERSPGNPSHGSLPETF